MAINENAQHWVIILTEGNYHQGQGLLRVGDDFCCLAVGCDIYDSSQWVRSPSDENNYKYLGAAGYMPEDVRVHFGVAFANGDFTIDQEFLDKLPENLAHKVREISDQLVEYAEFPENYCSLSDLNDSGVPFNEIGMVIAAEPKGLFGPIAERVEGILSD